MNKFLQQIDYIIGTLTKDEPEIQANFCDIDAYNYKIIFKGEVLMGDNRKAIAFEKDGSFLGGVTSEYFNKISSEDLIYFYVQIPWNIRTIYSLDVTVQDATRAIFAFPDLKNEIKEFQTLMKEKELVEQPVTKCSSTLSGRINYELKRITQGGRFPGDHDVTLTLKGKNAEGTEHDISKPTIRVHANYRFAINTGLVFSFLKDRDFFADKDGKITLHEEERILPILAVTYFWFEPRSYADDINPSWKNLKLLIPNPVVGLRLNNPLKDIFLGLEVEPVRGMQILYGGNLGLQKSLSGGQNIGNSLNAGQEPIIKENFQWGQFIGITFDVNLFGSKMLSGF